MNKWKRSALLPNNYKWVSLFVFISGICFSILGLTGLIPIEKEIIGLIMKQCALIALTILAVVRLKNEDELTLNIRLKSYGMTLFFILFLIILNPVGHYITDNLYRYDKDPTDFFIIGLLWFHIMFRIYIINR